MAARKHSSTTRLPQSLRDEIHESSTAAGRKRNSRVYNRKAERKAERQVAKQRKAQFFSESTGKSNAKRSLDAGADESNSPRKRAKHQSRSELSRYEASPVVQKLSKGGGHTESRKTKEELGSGGKSIDFVLGDKEKRSRVEEEENAYIAMLERQLGVKKDRKGKSKYGSGFEGEGLLDLLVDLDEEVLDNVEDGVGGELDADESFAEEDEESRGPGESDSSDEEKILDAEEGELWSGFTSEELDGQDEDKVGVAEPPAILIETSGRDPGSKYIPPHLRRQTAEDVSEVDAKLTRLLKGLLNRLSEQNIDSILKEVEGLYTSYTRHAITETLTSLIIEGTCMHSTLLDSYVALHAGLVACLYKIIGIELAAYFVQRVVTEFERYYVKARELSDVSTDPNEAVGKESSNLLVLLSDLYNYHVISCTLVYDIIRLILGGDLMEFDVELILKLGRGKRSSGAQLRQDDPSALKDIIQIVHSKLGDQRNASSRTRFMMETLNNLKNNKIKKDTAGAQGGSESKERIGKFVAGIGKRYHVHAHEPLRISLEDLHQADAKGKWWLVGAAWGGDPLVDQQASRELPSAKTTLADTENSLLKLARKQGMNTDVRRSVFVVLMSSDDYVDACDRLAQLNLTEVQQREIIRVLLHCCGNEKSYNPYYTLIAQHLCRQTHSHRVTLQYCFWDFLRSLGETKVGGAEMAKTSKDEQDGEQGFELDRVSTTRMGNVARAYAWLVAKNSIAITILKTLDFITLKNKTKTFLRFFFTHLFADTQDPSAVPSLHENISASILTRRDEKPLMDVFLKAARIPALAQDVSYFLNSTFRQSGTEDPTNAFLEWSSGVAKDVLESAVEDLR